MLGVSTTEILPVAIVGAVCVLAVLLLFRPMLMSSLAPESSAAAGISNTRMELIFLVIVAAATSLTLPVVGALLIFSLMIGPPAAARSLIASPMAAMGLSVVLAVLTVWAAIALSFETNWPIGFFVGMGGAVCYAAGRLLAWWRTSRASRTSPGRLVSGS